MNFKTSLGLLLVLLLSSCTVTLRKEEVPSTDSGVRTLVTPADGTMSGLVYALPKTGLRFTVTAHKIEKKRGEFYLYSERYLGLRDVILADAVEWELVSVAVEPFGVANADETFRITSSPNSPMPLIQLSEDGVLLSVNSAISMCGKQHEPLIISPRAQKLVPYTEEMLLANSTAKMAQEAANNIYRLRESRTALVSADLEVLPPDGDAYAMSLEELSDLESQFVSLFSGQEIVTSISKVIEIVPEEVKEKDVLFRFSTFTGVVAADDLSGSPFFIKMEGQDDHGVAYAVPDSAGLYYKKPAPIDISLLDGSNVILSDKILMGQFGQLQTLAPHLLNDDIKIQLYPATGGLKALMK